MLTGYFLIYNDKINLKKIVCESVYYGLFATLLFIISYALGYRFDDISSLISLLKYVVGDAILPISKGNWWFVTAYVLIVLLHPLINKLFMKLNGKRLYCCYFSHLVCLYAWNFFRYNFLFCP